MKQRRGIINTSDQLVKYIRRQLGEPVIRVEVPDESIEDIIFETILKFTEYNWEGELEKVLVIQSQGKGYYEFREPVAEVFEVKGSSSQSGMSFQQNYGQGYVPDFWIDISNNMNNIMSTMVQVSGMQALVQKYFSKDPQYNFVQGRNRLELLEDHKGPLMIHYQTIYVPEEFDMIYNHPWVKEYCIQKTKFLWGTITGKYSQPLIGGQTINYSDMKSEAENEITRLNEELLTKYTDPQPISIA